MAAASHSGPALPMSYFSALPLPAQYTMSKPEPRHYTRSNPQNDRQTLESKNQKRGFKSPNSITTLPPRHSSKLKINGSQTVGREGGKGGLILARIGDFEPERWMTRLVLQNVKDECFTSAIDEELHIRAVTFKDIPADVELSLEPSYNIDGLIPYSYLALAKEDGKVHSFAFKVKVTPAAAQLLDEIRALRRCMQFRISDRRQVDDWECLVEASPIDGELLGYLVKTTKMCQLIEESVKNLVKKKQVPLVLDIDHTVVRAVGPRQKGFVPEEQLAQLQDRCFELKDGRKIVVAEHYDHFLDWAKQFFEISVCSLGDQAYVDQVIKIIDPDGTRITGHRYSARPEYDFYCRRKRALKMPPKNLKTLFPFCLMEDDTVLGNNMTFPLIVDYRTQGWPTAQHYNVIVPTDQAEQPLWTISLQSIQHILRMIHAAFFNRVDKFFVDTRENRPMIPVRPPSVVFTYFELMRNSVTGLIHRGEPTGCLKLDQRVVPQPLLPPPPPKMSDNPEDERSEKEDGERSSDEITKAEKERSEPVNAEINPSEPWNVPGMPFEHGAFAPGPPGPPYMFPPEMGMVPIDYMDGPPPFGPGPMGPWGIAPGMMHPGRPPPGHGSAGGKKGRTTEAYWHGNSTQEPLHPNVTRGPTRPSHVGRERKRKRPGEKSKGGVNRVRGEDDAMSEGEVMGTPEPDSSQGITQQWSQNSARVSDWSTDDGSSQGQPWPPREFHASKQQKRARRHR